MSVAALSTSALALATGPVPAPATSAPAQVPEAFAELVARAKPDGKSSQDGTKPEGSAEGETETAVGGDEASATTPEDETKDPAIGAPADLLARINAMVTAAAQIGVSVPAPVIPIAPQTISTGTSAPAIAISLAAAPSPALASAPALPAIKPASAAADAAAPQAAPVAGALAVPQAAPVAGVPAVPQAISAPVTAPALPVDAALSPAVGTAPTDQATTIVRPAVLQRGSDIAQLLTSLRSAFASIDGKEAPAPATSAPAETPAPQPTVVTGPVSAAPAPAETVLPQAAVAALIATADAPVQIPNAAKPVTIDTTSGEEAAPQSIAAAPAAVAVSDAPIVVAAAPKVNPVVAALLTDAPVAAAPLTDLPATAADQPAVEADADPAPAADAPADGAAATATPLPAAAPSVLTPSASLPAGNSAPAPIDQSVTRELDLVRDNQWLDRLAHDISEAANRDGQIKFKLNPEHLGALTVEIANSAAGTAIKLTAETDQARAIIADAQPRLLAEVRAQGLRVAESHVDLNQQGSGGSASAQAQQQQQNRQSSEDSKPFVRTQTTNRDDAVDSAPDDDGELYA